MEQPFLWVDNGVIMSIKEKKFTVNSFFYLKYKKNHYSKSSYYKVKQSKDKTTEIFPPILLKPTYLQCREPETDPTLQKRTGLCPSIGVLTTLYYRNQHGVCGRLQHNLSPCARLLCVLPGWLQWPAASEGWGSLLLPPGLSAWHPAAQAVWPSGSSPYRWCCCWHSGPWVNVV